MYLPIQAQPEHVMYIKRAIMTTKDAKRANTKKSVEHFENWEPAIFFFFQNLLVQCDFFYPNEVKVIVCN